MKQLFQSQRAYIVSIRKKALIKPFLFSIFLSAAYAAPELRLHLSFNDADETHIKDSAQDFSVVNNNGSLINDGYAEKALRLNGTDSSLTVEGTKDDSFLGNLNEPFTISVYIRPDSHYEANYQQQAEILSTATGSRGPGVRLTYSYRRIILLTGDGKEFTSMMPKSLPKNIVNEEWNHIAVTMDINGIITLYVNGEEAYRHTGPVTLNAAGQDLTIGAYGKAGGLFKGDIDEVKIFTGTMTGEEIKGLAAVSGKINSEGGQNDVPSAVTDFSYYANHRYTHPVITAELAYSDDTWNRIESDIDYVKDIMVMNTQELKKLIPNQAGVYFVNCPNCTQNQLGAEFDWSVQNPGTIICKRCKHSYPSAKYPENKNLQARAPSGKMITYTYYDAPQGLRYFFSAGADWRKKVYLETAAQKLGKLYFNTSNEAYAEKAAQIICLFAKVFPDYCYKYEYPACSPEFFNGIDDERIVKTGWKLGRWGYQNWDVIPRRLVKAYDRIYHSRSLETTLKQLSIDRLKDIENGFFHRAAEGYFMLEERYDNLSPYFWSDAIMTGRVTGAPDYVHLSLRRVEKFLKNKFFLDGFWMEPSVDYMIQSTKGLFYLINYASAGYSDLPKEKSVYAVNVYTNFNLYTDFKDTVVLSEQCLSQVVFPDGQSLPMGDTWENSRASAGKAQKSYLQTGVGHAALCGPDGKSQPQLHMFYTPKEGHSHSDGLSIVLWSHGRQMLSDHGYTHTIYRPWITGTPAHNTVCVDYLSQSPGKNKGKGNIIYMECGNPLLQIIDAENAEMNNGKLYRRTCFMIQKDTDSFYIADFFQAGGGSTYDYMLHGNLQETDQVEWFGDSGKSVDCEQIHMVSAEQIRGWEAPKHETDKFNMPRYYAYGFLREVEKVKTAGDSFYSADMRGKNPAGLRVMFPNQENASFFHGKTPRARQGAKGSYPEPEASGRSFVAMRLEKKESAVFQSVICPYVNKPPVMTVSSLRSNVMLVEYGQDKDLIFYDQISPLTVTIDKKSVKISGLYGFISYRAGRIKSHHLVCGKIESDEGTIETFPDKSIALSATVTNDTKSFILTAPIEKSQKNSLSQFMRINHPDGQTQGYFIENVNMTSITVKGQLGFAYDNLKCRYTVFPHSKMSGVTSASFFYINYSK